MIEDNNKGGKIGDPVEPDFVQFKRKCANLVLVISRNINGSHKLIQ